MNVSCPHCRRLFPVREHVGGAVHQCPSCLKNVVLPMEQIPEAFLVPLDGDCKGQPVPLAATVTMGRGEECEVQVMDANVSRQHAQIRFHSGSFVVRDLGSRNGVLVNDARVTESTLQPGDVVRLGARRFRFEVPVAPPGADRGADGPAVSQVRREMKGAEAFDVSSQAGPEQTRKAYASLQAVYRVSEALVGVVQTDELLEKILSQVMEALPADRAYAILRHETSSDFMVRKARFREERHAENQQVPSQTILRRVVADQVSMMVADATTDERFDTKHSIISQGIRSVMCAPLAIGSSLFGVLSVDTLRSRNAFDAEDLKMLTAIARQASVALEHARLIRKVEDDTRTRGMLERYLAPELVDQVVNRRLEIKPGGQLSLLTILFSDIRGFTGLAESLSAGEVVELVNEYFGIMVEVLFRHGATLDKFIGDSIMAFWGAPVKRSDDALRAVQCALEMQSALAQFNELMKVSGQYQLAVGIGINTGSAVVGNFGSARRYEYTVLGDAVNVASRLQGQAQGGQILISESTFAAVSGAVQACALPAVQLRGRKGPVGVLLVTGLARPAP